jgi:hypothetical protein
MNAIESLQEAVRWSFELLEMTTADITPEAAAWTPPGTANPVGATYAHAVCSADFIVQSFIKREAPLFETTWAGKTGVSLPQLTSTYDWARNLEVDLPALREYAKAIRSNSENCILALSESDLDREMDLSGVGLGTQTLNWVISALLIAHLHNMTGEISVLKGLQGGRGYPF